jgi:hypothetical protein
MPVYSFQKLIEAAQGTDAATLTLESGVKQLHRKMLLRFVKDEAQ